MKIDIVTVKRALNRQSKRDEWFLTRYSLNPYRGCGFNCTYCYIHSGRYSARGGVAVKRNLLTLLSKELSKYSSRGDYEFIALGSATEPWMNLVEEKYLLTRKALNIIRRYRFPVHCLTKSTLIRRDLDILGDIMAEAKIPEDLRNTVKEGVLITFSFSTLKEEVAKLFEPGAPPPDKRLNTLKTIIDKGFMAGAAFMPILPYITDNELEEMARTAYSIGYSYVFFSPLTLDVNENKVFLQIIRRYYPELADKYTILYRYSNNPSRSYTDKFYRKVLEVLARYNMKFGITGNICFSGFIM